MKTLLETTVWPGATPNHVYFVNDSRDRMFGYVPTNSDIPVRFSVPIRFDARRRKFQAVPNRWTFSTESEQATRTWTVTGSKGNQYTVSEHAGIISCSCPGFQFRNACRHVDDLQDCKK